MSKTWPLPALLSWLACWLLFLGGSALGASPAVALALAAAFGVSLSFFGATTWRRAFIAAGFPLSIAASGLAGSPPAWAWLLPLALLLFLYPLRAWRDAPLFPTPAGALSGLAELAPLAPGARIVDAGCGVGDGLRELRREFPDARIE